MLDHEGQVKPRLAAAQALVPTPTDDALPRRYADFATMTEALDYVAQGRKGMNFHDARANLARVYPYAELRQDAIRVAHRLKADGIGAGDRVALIAETAAEFVALFYGAMYAGAWPVPLPLPTSFGGKDAYIDQLAVQLNSSDPALLLYPPDLPMAGDAAKAAGFRARDWASFLAAEVPPCPLDAPKADDIAYLQYSSGSTRFPHGVMVTHRALMSNLEAHAHSMLMGEGDRGGVRGGASPGRLRRHRLFAIFERLDPFYARRRHHPPRAAQQSRGPQPRDENGPGGSRGIVAPLLS